MPSGAVTGLSIWDSQGCTQHVEGLTGKEDTNYSAILLGLKEDDYNIQTTP